MNINNHLNLILDNYNLTCLYRKFIGLAILTTFVKESFYWFLVYFSELVKNKPKLITIFSMILIGLICINIPIERYFNYIKTKLIIEIKIANTKYYNDKIIKMSKQELLNFDLVKYYNSLNSFNENLGQYILNIKNKIQIPIRIITLIIIALTKKFSIIIGLFAIFYAVVKSLNKHKLEKENVLTKKSVHYQGLIRNYIINSKNFLINDEFNKDYLTSNVDNFGKVTNEINEINDTMDMNINVAMVVYIMIVMWLRIHELNQYDFFTYFLIIYDIEFISDKVQEYYKNKTINNQMCETLTYLNSFTPSNGRTDGIADGKTDGKTDWDLKINEIIIKKIYNNSPKIELNTPIIIKSNDHILISGESGNGKTILFYVLKGLIKPTVLDINPNIDNINRQTYLTLPNHKSLYSGNLYDIITNYDTNPNIELINFSLKSAKIDGKFNGNNFINIDKSSSGELIRLLIARIIYIVKTKNYNILLFDEIDENINNDLAVEICLNLRNIFKDKIILYITHNEKVKLLFNKKYVIKNGVIN